MWFFVNLIKLKIHLYFIVNVRYVANFQRYRSRQGKRNYASNVTSRMLRFQLRGKIETFQQRDNWQNRHTVASRFTFKYLTILVARYDHPHDTLSSQVDRMFLVGDIWHRVINRNPDFLGNYRVNFPRYLRWSYISYSHGIIRSISMSCEATFDDNADDGLR